MNWLRNWWARRLSRRKVDWRDCVWSPQKAAEQRFKENLVRHWGEYMRVTCEAQIRKLAAEMQTSEILREASRRQNEKAREIFKDAYDVYLKRHQKS